MMVTKLLSTWGWDGFEQHVQSTCAFYERQRDIFLNAVEEHLDGVVECVAPDAGMFVWMKINGVKDTMDLISSKAVDARVLLLPGSVFVPQCNVPSPFVRASYSTASEEEINEALKRKKKIENKLGKE